MANLRLVRRDPFEVLRESEGDLPNGVAREIRALGVDAIPRLLRIAETPRPKRKKNEDFHARAHAIRLLAELRAPETHRRLLLVFLRICDDHGDDRGWDACVTYMSALGRPFIDKAFELIREEPARGDHLVFLLSHVPEPDDRVAALMNDFGRLHPRDVGALLNCPLEAHHGLAIRTMEKLGLADSSHGLDLVQYLNEIQGEVPHYLRDKVAAWNAASRRQSGYRR